jgi:hypothetical protein
LGGYQIIVKGCVILKKVKLASIIVIIFIVLFNFKCYANSAEPPSILIIVPNASDNLEVSIESGGNVYKSQKIDKLMESYYAFYSSEMKRSNDYVIVVSSENERFEINLDRSLKNYNNIFTLDLTNETLTEGKLLSRSILLVVMRVVLTLIIEALIFWMFGFRKKESWIAFLAINLVTQGALNIWINGFIPVQSYIVFSLIFGEIFVFIAEIIGFVMFCTEHNNLEKIVYVIVANFASLMIGGYILSVLPI